MGAPKILNPMPSLFSSGLAVIVYLDSDSIEPQHTLDSSRLWGPWYVSNKETILFINIGSSNLNSWLGYSSGVLQVSSSSALGENVLEGPLSYVQVIIYAEIIIILFALNVNILGVFTGLISESIKELKVAKNIGFTNYQLIVNLLYELRYLGVVVTVIGGIIGMIINWILLVSDSTILFGYTFYPVYDLKIWIIDIIAIYFLALISASIGLKTENIN